ncbi:uncharacterized protein [Oscarella lobularis]|uniref:uncharacterized protein isoform X2 n=1 Tax=Oscarella lobularis TaxID=121494 RepID=UPI00331414D4
MSALIDKRWESIVRPIFSDLVRVLDPDSLLDRLYSEKLVTDEEHQHLRAISTRQEKSRMLLKEILPRKGPTSYDQFVTIVRKTEGQEHVVKVLEGEKRSSAAGEERKNELEKKLAESEKKRTEWEKKHEESEKKRAESEMKRTESEKKLSESEKKNAKSEMTNIGLRNKIGRWDGGHLKWKQFESNMPIDWCWPFGCVAEINGMIHVGWLDRMFQLKEGAWKGEKHDLGFRIGSVFECEGKGYVMEGGGVIGAQCKRIYEWKSETRDLELLTEIPHEYQLNDRSAIGHNGNIYLVGGYPRSDRVDCFDINKGEWEPIKKMKNERYWCSLAVIDDKMFVGGGEGAGNSVECFLMKEQKWIDINPTTKYGCQFSSLNGKLVATGGRDWKSNCVELYDELSGDWLPLPSMNEGRCYHGACETKDNQLVVVGGEGAKNSLECLKL